jgi:hypothetical protein
LKQPDKQELFNGLLRGRTRGTGRSY